MKKKKTDGFGDKRTKNKIGKYIHMHTREKNKAHSIELHLSLNGKAKQSSISFATHTHGRIWKTKICVPSTRMNDSRSYHLVELYPYSHASATKCAWKFKGFLDYFPVAFQYLKCYNFCRIPVKPAAGFSTAFQSEAIAEKFRTLSRGIVIRSARLLHWKF